ncbi:MAG: aminotransferase class V-fold PLP-dependent enzyme, partial [Oscillospiraceae bacterium]
FTSCGTESDNWALRGAAFNGAKKGKKHIITSAIEHHAILHTAAALERQGFTVTYLPVNSEGLVSPKEVEAAITPETALVSIMYANNEIGTIEPISEIGEICKRNNVLFHTDAVQAVGNVKIDVKAQNIDMLSLSGHKINTPKGIGAFYMRRGVVIENFMEGGAQENRRRAGTENVPYIMGLGASIEDLTAHIDERAAHKKEMRDFLAEKLLKEIPKCRINGSMEKRLAVNLNISFEGIEGEGLLLLLDMNGICASSGSACASGSLDPSHVLMAIGLPHEIAHGSLRISLGDQNTMEDVQYIAEKLPAIVERLRAMSPVWDGIKDK